MKGNTRMIDIYCNGCRAQLYRYRKVGQGHLVKCYEDEITKDFTNGDLKCPECGTQFARRRTIHARPAHKIIQGKVFVR